MDEKMRQTEVFKSLAPDEQASDIEGLLADVDKLDTTQTADVWVDTGTKLIRAVRFPVKDSQDYFEVGLKYIGGNEFPFFVNAHAVDTDGVSSDLRLTATLNTNDNTVNINADIDMSDDSVTGYVKGTVVRSNEPVAFDVPADAKPVMELIGNFYGGMGMEGAPTDDVLGIQTPFDLFSN